MKEVVFNDEDPNGPFGTGPALPDPDRLYDPIFEQFGDYDAFGPFAWRDVDYSFKLDVDDEE